MPIKIPDDLPARATLAAEGVMVMGEADAVRQDIRPLRIGLLNLMPEKPKTEDDPDGLSPTRYGDWVRNGIAVDF